MKIFWKQLNNYLLIMMSILVGIDDFSCNPKWEKDKSIWENARNIIEE